MINAQSHGRILK